MCYNGGMSENDKKAKIITIKFSKRTNIRQVFTKKGCLVAEYVSTPLILPKSSMKAKKQNVVEKLQELSDGLKISGEFANGMARVVMNWKKPKNRRKLKVFIVTAKNDLRFERTFETAYMQLKVAMELLKRADELEIDDEGRAKLGTEIRDRYVDLMQFPKDFVKLPQVFRETFPLPNHLLRSWYAHYNDKPEWMFAEVSDEAIKEFFDAKCAEAQPTTPTGGPSPDTPQDCPSESPPQANEKSPDAARGS